MEWSVNYDAAKKDKGWGVYRHAGGKRYFEERFETEEEARYYAEKKESRYTGAKAQRAGKVDQSSMDSFPASDAPGWIKVTANPHTGGKQARH